MDNFIISPHWVCIAGRLLKVLEPLHVIKWYEQQASMNIADSECDL